MTEEKEYQDYPLASLTSWHIGGKAERFYEPTESAALERYLATLPASLPRTWLGLGSNVLIRDGGIPGCVISTRGLRQLYQQEDGCVVAEAGVSCAKFARFCTRLGFSRAAFFAGIPGTIGGALAMNAGAFGGETWKWVVATEVLGASGQPKCRTAQDYTIGYRTVKGHLPEQSQEVFVKGIFWFPSDQEDGLSQIRALLRERADKQPIGTFNCGSVYRNPQGAFAAKLIEACQLKGYQIGDAVISEKHANFIINQGQASARDVETLMAVIEERVRDRFGIALEREVKILGVPRI